MAQVQKQFENFHEVIRVDYDMSNNLREKRDIIVKKIKDYLRSKGLPTCEPLLQGSYKMKTGVRPIAGLEYDIDLGLRFDINEKDHSAATVRKWVLDAVEGHTKRIKDKGPCIRVAYEDGFHVDLVVYAVWQDGAGTDQYRLAHKTDGWRPADPPALLNHVSDARKPFEGTEDSATQTDQFRRCVRYLRRWNDEAIPREEKGKATGLAFVLLAMKHLQPAKRFDKSDDRTALERLATAAETTVGRIVAKKPTPEYEDMFGRMSEMEMNDLKARFGTLAQTLRSADSEPDPVIACSELQKVFGEDFPIPPPEDTGKRTEAPAVITSSSSA